MLGKIASKILTRPLGHIKNVSKSSTAHIHQRNDQFYQDLLQSYEMDDTIRIKEKSTTAACPPHFSLYFEVNQIEIVGTHQNGKEYKKSLLTKELPMKEQVELYRTDLALENEVAAFNGIVPYLKSSRIELPIPNCLYAVPDIVILENMLTEGYELVDKSIKGLTLEQCKLTVKALAKIHASSIVFQTKNSKEFAKLITMPSREMLYHKTETKIFDHQSELFTNLMARIKKQPFSADNNHILQVLKLVQDNSREIISQFIYDTKKLSVICHGSLLSTNIYFKNNEVILSDLSQIRYNSPAWDLTYLFYVNLDPNVRMESTDEILDVYLKALHTYTSEQGVDIDRVYTKKWLGREMKIFTMYGLAYGLWTTRIFYTKSELKNTTKPQHTSQTLEHLEDEYVERAKNIILSYINTPV